MLITRWQAPQIPEKEQFMAMLESEGLEPQLEELKAGEKISEHRHPFSEVRIVVAGELLLSIAGNQTLLRTGDRIEIAANTKHWHQTHGPETCVCLCAYRVY